MTRPFSFLNSISSCTENDKNYMGKKQEPGGKCEEVACEISELQYKSKYSNSSCLTIFSNTAVWPFLIQQLVVLAVLVLQLDGFAVFSLVPLSVVMFRVLVLSSLSLVGQFIS